METREDQVDLRALTRETQAIWDGNADWWADYMGEGNAFQLQIANPPTERLLDLQPGERVLDIACGNGAFARRLVGLDVDVVAFDFSERFVAWARRRSSEIGDKIEYHVLDATDEAALLTLGERRFDAAVCNMALMDMTTIAALLTALARLLKVGGRFVFSVQHPCFNSNAVRFTAEQEDRSGEIVTTHALKLTDYLHVPPGKGLGVSGQPQPHYYFHRPLNLHFGECFRAGFVLDGLEEPADAAGPRPERPFSWANVPDIPVALVARMRLVR